MFNHVKNNVGVKRRQPVWSVPYIAAVQMRQRRSLKKCTIHSGFAAVLAAMAGLIATLSRSVPAQAHAIVVNGLSCPTASVEF